MSELVINQEKKIADRLKREFFLLHAFEKSAVQGVSILEFPPESSRYILQVFLNSESSDSLPEVYTNSLGSISLTYEVTGEAQAFE